MHHLNKNLIYITYEYITDTVVKYTSMVLIKCNASLQCKIILQLHVLIWGLSMRSDVLACAAVK
jgi:hypothetical protein